MNGGEKDEMLAVLGEIFIGTGLAMERGNLEQDLIKLNVDARIRTDYLKLVDDYFHSIYKQMQKDNVEDIDKKFDFDFTTHTQLSRRK